MPLPMNHPDYRYKPWPAERRLAASRAGKERWARKREMEPKPSITAKSYVLEAQALFERLAGIERDKVAVEERMSAMLCASRYLQETFPKDADLLESAYKQMAEYMEWE